MKNKLRIAALTFAVSLCNIAFATTVDEFNSTVAKLDGKTKDDVVSALGKPAGYQSGGAVEYFRYEGIDDKYTGKKSTASIVYFKNGKVSAKDLPPKHYFEKLPF